MKVAELEGALLDYWVATALDEGNGGNIKSFRSAHRLGFLHYSTEWALGGRVIERERIEIVHADGYGWMSRKGGIGPFSWNATTPLIAAMRAYVASKFGSEVPEVPDA